MPIDLNQLQQSFIEESLEMLELMEKLLIEIDLNKTDLTKINEIFRIIHSLKSGSAIFDFNPITDFAHMLENILDPMRSGDRKIDEEMVNLFLKSIDCFRSMISDIQYHVAIDDSCARSLEKSFTETQPEKALRKLAAEERAIKTLKTPPSQKKFDNKEKGLKINFRPEKDFWKTEGEPYHLFKILSQLGTLVVQLNIQALPSFDHLEPSDCLLSWDLILYGEASKEEVRDMFEWVSNKNNVEILSFSGQSIEKETETSTRKTDDIFGSASATTLRVAAEKIDTLINIVGELIITQSTLQQLSKDLETRLQLKLQEELEILDNKSRELQESAMRIRMVPIGYAFNRLPRLVKELTLKMNKKVELIITGAQTELDKITMEKIVDPLVHLVRNAIDHGIESPKKRDLENKPSKGIVQVNAYEQGGRIIIDVIDDGAGIDKEKIRAKAIEKHWINEGDKLTDDDLYELICRPGFTTSEQINNISGRGVGMDVVMKNIRALGGSIDIQSEIGKGTVIHLVLPLTLAIMDCQVVKICNQVFVIPLISITEIIKININDINHLGEETEFYHLRDIYVPIVRLANTLSLSKEMEDLSEKFIIILSVGNRLFGFVVDELVSQQQVVIKSLEENYKKVVGISGATIFGDGSIALIIDPNGIVELTKDYEKNLQSINFNKNLKSSMTSVNEEDALFEEEDHKISQMLTFFMQGEEYGVNILEVKEIRSWQSPTPIPNTPTFIQGIINLRGVIIPVVDLRDYYKLGHIEYGRDTSIIVLTIKQKDKMRTIGVVVDAVSDTYHLPEREILPIPDCYKSLLIKHVRGLISINNRTISLLKTDDLLPIVD